MQINRWILDELSDEQRATLMNRVQTDVSALEPLVQQIIDDVRKRGDQALVEYTAKHDKADVAVDAIKVTDAEFDAAEKLVSPALRDAMQKAHDQIASHHQEQIPQPGWLKETQPGVISGERVTPIASAGLYVPRGKGSFPSVMLMLATPAVMAGVPEVAVCTPPGPDGTIDAASLVCARICGVKNVYKVGGAQAIAALAYGTQTVPKVEKIVGPGNQYVSAAKRLVYGVVQLGTPAGPSESLILCDETADPEIAVREWLVEAEHGPDTPALLVTHDDGLIDKVSELVGPLVESLDDTHRSFVETGMNRYGGIVKTNSLEESIAFTNDYAAEHVRVLTSDPWALLHRIDHAGEVLLGDHASIGIGVFAIGVNAILPTSQGAKSASCVGIHDFVKRSSFAYLTPEGAKALAPIAVELAQWEDFPSHERGAQFSWDRAEGKV